MNNLIEVDADLIMSLKREGKRVEANAMLKAYQTNLRKSWKQGKKEIHRISSKIYRLTHINQYLFHYYFFNVDGNKIEYIITPLRKKEETSECIFCIGKK